MDDITRPQNEEVLHILVADFVPLRNKGEEAIIRGIEDMLRDTRPIKIGLFGEVDMITQSENITIFPLKWIFRCEGVLKKTEGRELRLQLKRAFIEALISLQLRFGYYSKLKNLISSANSEYRPLQEFFSRSKYIIVGHAPLFCVESCGIIHLAKKAGKRTGILGSQHRPPTYTLPYRKWIYRRAMRESDFCVFRDRHSYERMKYVNGGPGKLRLAPDSAFAMQPASQEKAFKVFNKYSSLKRAREAGRPIVAVTVLETGVVYWRSFLNTDSHQKQQIHAEFVGKILNTLVVERNAYIIFLPHSILKDRVDDVQVANRIGQAMTSGINNYTILNEDLGSRVLKAIICECDFFVGERAHSLIASVSVSTPFIALTNKADYRIHSIIGEMCQCEEQIINMDNPDMCATCKEALRLFDKREDTQRELDGITRWILEELNEVAALIKNVEIKR